MNSVNSMKILLQGCLPEGGVSAWGVSPWRVSAQRGAGVCLGGSARGFTQGGLPGGVCLGVSAQGVFARGCVSQHALGQTPPVDRMTDACENITLPQLCCGRVQNWHGVVQRKLTNFQQSKENPPRTLDFSC